jgi:hypothetical protein
MNGQDGIGRIGPDRHGGLPLRLTVAALICLLAGYGIYWLGSRVRNRAMGIGAMVLAVGGRRDTYGLVCPEGLTEAQAREG